MAVIWRNIPSYRAGLLLTDFMEVNEGLLEPCSQEPYSLWRFTFIEQPKERSRFGMILNHCISTLLAPGAMGKECLRLAPASGIMPAVHLRQVS